MIEKRFFILQFVSYLGSTHIVCERLSVMQDLAWVLRICAQNPQNTLFLASQEYSPPGLELLMEDLVTSGLRLPRIPPHPPPDWNFSWRT